MQPSSARTGRAPASTLWAGRIMTGLAVVFLLFDSAMKVMRLAPALEGTAQLGYPTSLVFGIGCLQLACVVLYAIPLTSVLGAILLTGYLGGAVATHVRVGSPLFTHVLFPVYLGLLIWGGLFFLEDRLRALIPLRNPKP